jgi:hypothetical protein
MKNNDIQFIPGDLIDEDKWDACVQQSPIPLWYGLSRSWKYLSRSWFGLVWGDYEAVMPFAYRKKWGIIPYIYQPPFIQQAGLYTRHHRQCPSIDAFLNALPHRFVRQHVHLNYHTPPPQLPGIRCSKRVSYVLDLNRSYADIRQGFSKDAEKNLRKLERLPGLRYDDHLPFTQVQKVYQAAYGALNPHLTERDYRQLSLLSQGQTAIKMKNIGVYDGEVLLSAGCFIESMGRLTYTLGGPTPTGKTYGATHALLNVVIEQHAGLPLEFDFEGSMIPNVAQFYRKFGPQERHYWAIKKGIL